MRPFFSSTLAALCFSASAAVATPLVVSHSGFVLNASDAPLDAVSQAFTFTLFDLESGGAAQWTATCNVPVRAGYYATNLGAAPCAGDGLDTGDLPVGATRWLEVTIGTATTTPRLRLGAIPSATVAAELGGHPASDFWLRTDAVDAATLGTQSLAQLDARYVKPAANGNVGLGVPTPGVKLDVAGVVRSTTGGFTFPDATTQITAGITAISATTPLAITAGTTPTLSLGTASGTTTGALTSTDYLAFSAKVNRSGDTMGGALDMGSHRITNLLDPSGPQDAATKTYVDTKSTLPVATASTLGGVKVGSGLSVGGDGTLSVTASSDPGASPIGAIIAWHKSLSGTPALPSNWVECNGQTISVTGSPLNGQVAPDLNGGARFLRGSSTSGAMQNATQVAVTLETNSAALFFDASNRHMTAYNADFDSTQGLGASERGIINKSGTDSAVGQIYAGRVRPVNMSVVWIMRVK